MCSYQAKFASRLSATPTIGLGFHLEPEEFHTAVKWWLGLGSHMDLNVPWCLVAGLRHLIWISMCPGAWWLGLGISYGSQCALVLGGWA